MKNRIFSFIIILSVFLGGTTKLFAQSEISKIAFFPSWDKLYYYSNYKNQFGETSNIERFFTELKEWSKIFKEGVVVHQEYNAIFVKHFTESYMDIMEQHSKFISLPMRVKVTKYDCDLMPFIYKQSELYDNILPVSIQYFTPVLDSDRDVVYISEKAEKLLIDFIEEPENKTKKKDGDVLKVKKAHVKITRKDYDEMRKRMEMIEEYIPAQKTHWGETWFFMSYPQITSFIVGKDGYIISIDHLSFSGTEYFVPWEGEPVEISSWIQ